MKKNQPYDKLSIIYDKLMSHVNYKHWADYIVNLFQYSDIKIDSIIDISCGTGSLLTKFIKRKYFFYGSDISLPMIRQAAPKFDKNVFMVSDVKRMSVKSNSFDAVIFLYDSLNYMQNEIQINSLFKEVNRILIKGGIFVFDIITDLLCKTHYNNFEEHENWNDSGYLRHSYYDNFNKIQHNDFQINLGNKIYLESHMQRVFPESKIEEYLNYNQFELAAHLDDFTFSASNEDSERIHYVCIKKQNIL